MLQMSSTKPNKTNGEWTILYCRSMEDVQEAVNAKSFIFAQIQSACKDMLANGTTAHMCTEIWCMESLSSIWVSVTLDESVDSLERALTWYRDREEYEECVDIANLLELVRERLIEIQIETALK